MKIARLKKAQKILNYYATNYGFREPYQLIIDGTFCLAALQNKVAIEEQIMKYFQSQIKLITTQCIILETESLGAKLIGASILVKKCIVHKCGHEGKPTTGASCISSMIKSARYIVATQDRNLQSIIRNKPGRPLIYIHKNAPILEMPSDCTRAEITKKIRQIVNVKETEKDKIDSMKKVEGIAEEIKPEQIKWGRKRPKNPNPLSCKKKKKRSPENSDTQPKNTKSNKIIKSSIKRNINV